MEEDDKKRKREQVDLPEDSNAASVTEDEPTNTEIYDDDTTSESSEDDDDQTEKKEKKKPKRCEFPSCRTKLFLTSYSCYCGNFFCALHTPPEEHNCNFDYHAMAKKKIKEDNPKVVKEKVPEI